jgi:hypothetical protein
MAEDNYHPWRIYDHEFDVPRSKMGKAQGKDMDKSDTDKGYPLMTSSGEGSKVTPGGATLHLYRPKEKQEKKELGIHLGGAPKASKAMEMLDDMSKTAISKSDDAISTLKACKSQMEKSEEEKKAYLGTLAIPEKVGAKPKFTGEGAMRAGASYGDPGAMKPGQEKVIAAQESGAMKPSTPLKPSGGPQQMGKSTAKDRMAYEQAKKDLKDRTSRIVKEVGEFARKRESEKGEVEKAITSMAVPRMPRAMQQELIRRNAQSVMTRGNSRFAKDIHTGPLTGEVVDEIEGDAMRRTTQEVFKSCDLCGRRYRLLKGIDSGCPTCSVNKSSYCGKCGQQLVKSHGGSIHCPLCG